LGCKVICRSKLKFKAHIDALYIFVIFEKRIYLFVLEHSNVELVFYLNPEKIRFTHYIQTEFEEENKVNVLKI